MKKALLFLSLAVGMSMTMNAKDLEMSNFALSQINGAAVTEDVTSVSSITFTATVGDISGFGWFSFKCDESKKLTLTNGTNDYVASSVTRGAGVSNVFTATFSTPIEAPGTYSAVFEQGLINNGTDYSSAYTVPDVFTIAGASTEPEQPEEPASQNPFDYPVFDPADGATVTSIKTINLSFDGPVAADIFGVPASSRITLTNDKGYSASATRVMVGSDYKTVEIYFEEVTAPGEYTLTFPANQMNSGSSTTNPNPEYVVHYTIEDNSTPEEPAENPLDKGYTVTPADGVVESLTTIEVKFTDAAADVDYIYDEDYNLAKDPKDYITLTREGGEPVKPSENVVTTYNESTEKYDGFTIVFPEQTEAGTYTLNVPAELFVQFGSDPKLYSPEITATYTIEEKTPAVTYIEGLTIDPDTEVVKSLQKFTLSVAGGSLSRVETGNFEDTSLDATLKNTTTDEVYTLFGFSKVDSNIEIIFSNNSNTVAPITTPGQYLLTIPEGALKDANGAINNTLTRYYTIEKPNPFEAYAITPAAGEVDELSKFELTFTNPEADFNWVSNAPAPYIMKGETRLDATPTQKTHIQEGSRWMGIGLTFDAITEAGEYTLVFPAGMVVTYSNANGPTNPEIRVNYTVVEKAEEPKPFEGAQVAETELTLGDEYLTVNIDLPNGNGYWIYGGEEAWEGIPAADLTQIVLMNSDNYNEYQAVSVGGDGEGKLIIDFPNTVPAGNYGLFIEVGAFSAWTDGENNEVVYVQNPGMMFTGLKVVPNTHTGVVAVDWTAAVYADNNTEAATELAELTSVQKVILNSDELDQALNSVTDPYVMENQLPKVDATKVKLTLDGNAYTESEITVTVERRANSMPQFVFTFEPELTALGTYSLETEPGFLMQKDGDEAGFGLLSDLFTIVEKGTDTFEPGYDFSVYYGDGKSDYRATYEQQIYELTQITSIRVKVNQSMEVYPTNNVWSTDPSMVTITTPDGIVPSENITIAPESNGYVDVMYARITFSEPLTTAGTYGIALAEGFFTNNGQVAAPYNNDNLCAVVEGMSVQNVVFTFTVTDEEGTEYNAEDNDMTSLPNAKSLTIVPTYTDAMDADTNEWDLTQVGEIKVIGADGVNVATAVSAVVTDTKNLSLTFDETLTATGSYTVILPEGLLTSGKVISAYYVKADAFGINNDDTAILNIYAPDGRYTVVDLAGRVLVKDGDRNAVKNLRSGMYIVNGQKVVLK